MPDTNPVPRRLIWALLLLLPAVSTAGIYSWTDENGKVHFGDRPPIDSKADEIRVRVNTYESASEISQVDFVSAPDRKVVLYTTQRCGYCKKAKQFLQRNSIAYREYDVETSSKGKRDFKKLNGQGVPIILVGKQRMDGFSEGRMAAMLRNAGYEP